MFIYLIQNILLTNTKPNGNKLLCDTSGSHGSLLGYSAACRLDELDRRFRGAYCLHHRRAGDGGSTRYITTIGIIGTEVAQSV
jgi:hypothetical protein